MSRSKGGKKGMGRRPVTRDMLLPLPPPQVRALSLPAHLALAALRGGQGDPYHVSLLSLVACRTSLMVDLSATEIDEAVLVQADAAVQRLLQAGDLDRWSASAEDSVVFARLLTLYDRLLEALPCRWYFAAEAQLNEVIARQPLSSWAGMPVWCLPGLHALPFPA